MKNITDVQIIVWMCNSLTVCISGYLMQPKRRLHNPKPRPLELDTRLTKCVLA